MGYRGSDSHASEVLNQAKGVSREKALTFDSRPVRISSSRALWNVSGGSVGRSGLGPRAATAIVRVTDTTEDVPLLPGLPDVTGVTLGVPVVRVWDDYAEDWTAAPYRKRPAGRVRVSASGEYDISVTADASSTIPAEALEGVSRFFAYRETLRPGDITEVTGEQQVLAGAFMKSGAAEVLRAITLNYL